MEVLQKEAAVKQKELSKAEKLTKKLHDELQSLNAHMTTNMVGKADFEAYKRAINEKVTIENFTARKGRFQVDVINNCFQMDQYVHVHVHCGLAVLCTLSVCGIPVGNE